MSYQALYRKYRPKTFDGIIGQNHITDTLANQIQAGKIVHAYLFCGSRGTGKTSTAKIFARAINCLSPQNGSACGKCAVCTNSASEMDIIEIDAASNNRVDEIRDLRENVKFMPTCGKYKIYIIDEVHMLTDSAYNALLKTLEEPPSHVVFILATTEAHKLPATILSRCVRFDFELVSVENLTKHLADVFTQEGIKYEEEALKVIASAGEGSVRDTLSIADSVTAYAGGNITLAKVLEILSLNDADLARCRNRFETRDYRYIDACRAALFHEVIVDLIVEEHLGDDIVCSCVNFTFQVCDVGLQIRRLEMLLRICSDSNAEVSVIGLEPSFPAICVASLVASDAFHKLARIAVAAKGRGEPFFARHAVSTQRNNIVNSHESQVVQLAFDLFRCTASADDMRHDFHVIFRHDRSAYSCLTDAVSNQVLCE